MATAAKKLDRVKNCAPFTPISPVLNITELVQSSPNFRPVDRVDARTINATNIENLQTLIKVHVIDGGRPLVIENWHLRDDWPRWIFNPEWLDKNHGTDVINIRDIPEQADVPMTMRHYLKNLSTLASKFTPYNFAAKRQRLYAKDIDCPPAWHKALKKVLPTCTFYLSPSDLMSSLPPDARAQNLMCYIGHEGTYTPAHKEMCASLGQNLMVHTSGGPNPGSSIWFMTSTRDREAVAEYWLGDLGHDIEVESHFASIDAFKNVPFPVYVVEQKLGDYVLVPPLAPHQVWNRGEVTMKVAWNRTTPETLKLAIHEALPKARLVCRDEQYNNKAIIYETLKKYFEILSDEDKVGTGLPGLSREKMATDFQALFKLFDEILLDEEFNLDKMSHVRLDKAPNEFSITCSFCRGNIFNRFLTCKNCIIPEDGGEYDGEDDQYDVCLECYVRGRSCGCISGLQWVEQLDWQQLIRDHDKFRALCIAIDDGNTDATPQEFDTGVAFNEKKSLAWACQEQLKARPFEDSKKYVEGEPDFENETKLKKQEVNCHICKARHPPWKVAKCSDCSKAYCYGSLWRAFDIDPSEVITALKWKCPVCIGICSCGQCRRNGRTRPYEPKATMLGFSVKHVCDPRSASILVDFSKGNLGWLHPDADSRKRKRSSTSMELDEIDESPRGPSRSYVDDVPIDLSLRSEDESHSVTNGQTHADMEPYGPDSQFGNGQYTSNDSSSVALVERGSARFNGSRMLVDGLVCEEDCNRGRSRPILPSPKDMLTGALPSRGRDSRDTHIYHLSPTNSYSLPGKQSKKFRGEVQSYRRQSLAQGINSDDQSLILWPEMSSLERNPAAFIAAAGLNMLSGGTGLQEPHEPPPTWRATSTTPTAAVAENAGDDFDQTSPHPIAIHPRMLMRNTSEFDSAFQDIPTDQFSSENYRSMRPSSSHMQVSTESKHKQATFSSNFRDLMGGDVSMTEPTKSMREMITNDWIKKQKLAKVRAANLKGKGKNKKSLIVVLKLGKEGWQKWDELKVEPDLVTKELVLGGGMVQKVLIGKAGSGDVASGGRTGSASVSAGGYMSGGGTGSIVSGKRGRGRPSKNLVIDQDEDDEKDDEDEDKPEVIRQPKAGRKRESAWMVKKREEEAKEEAINEIENEKRAREKAIEDAKKARLKAIEDEKRRIEEEKRRIEDEKRAIEEEKIQKEKDRLQAIQDEKDRTEAERRRAYQEAKMMAAKTAEGYVDAPWYYDSEEEYEEAHYSEVDNQGMTVEDEGREEGREWWEPKLPGSLFAVAIGRRPGYHWRTQYITEAELALKPGEPDESIAKVSAPTPTGRNPKATQPTAKTRDTKRRSTSTAAVSDIAPIPQSRRKPVTTKKTTPQKSSDITSSGDEYTASKWSQRKKQVEKVQSARTDGPAESVKDGLRRRSAASKYHGAVEYFGDNVNTADWETGAIVGDGEDMDVDMVVVKDEVAEVDDGYDDRWKRGGRKWMW